MSDSLETQWNVSIDSCSLLKHLGSGGYGTVFLARYYLDEPLRVVKVLHQLGHDPEKRFEREIRILQERANENYVQILDFGVTSQGHRFYVMEYCPLGDIRKLVGQVNVNFVETVIKHVCNALLPCHERGGFHRDLKPENVLLSYSNNRLVVKLTDFGLAQDNNTSSYFTNGGAGTFGYIAPEVVRGQPFTPQADIFSLGVTARELLSGVLGSESTEAFGSLGAITARMIHPNPDRRPSAIEVLRYLERPKQQSAISKLVVMRDSVSKAA